MQNSQTDKNTIQNLDQIDTATEFDRSTEKVPLFTPVGVLSLSLILLAGVSMQSYANETIHAFLMAFIFLFVGLAGVSLIFPGKKPERRAFIISFTICIFVGGLAQCYSLNMFNQVQSTYDAHTFFVLIKAMPPFTTMADISKGFNSPLAVLIWQQIYKLTWLLGFDFGVYPAVMFNALVIGVTGSITVQTAREVFGDDSWRLRRVGTLFAFCGLFLLLGSILLRDCFTLFFNVLVLWGLVRWLCRPKALNFLFAIVLTAVSVFAIAYLRFPSIALFGIYWLLALFCWFLKRRINFTSLFALYFVFGALIIGSTYMLNYLQFAQEMKSERADAYLGKSEQTSNANSLGMQLIINQPLPIKLFMGTGSLMICPIPLWGYFKSGIQEYLIIKGYNGIYQVLLLPLLFAGIFKIVVDSLRDYKQEIPFIFLLVYLLFNVGAVVATSMEQRHLAQYLPALFILAVVADTREYTARAKVKQFALLWFIFVFFVHGAWKLLR